MSKPIDHRTDYVITSDETNYYITIRESSTAEEFIRFTINKETKQISATVLTSLPLKNGLITIEYIRLKEHDYTPPEP